MQRRDARVGDAHASQSKADWTRVSHLLHHCGNGATVPAARPLPNSAKPRCGCSSLFAGISPCSSTDACTCCTPSAVAARSPPRVQLKGGAADRLGQPPRNKARSENHGRSTNVTPAASSTASAGPAHRVSSSEGMLCLRPLVPRRPLGAGPCETGRNISLRKACEHKHQHRYRSSLRLSGPAVRTRPAPASTQ